MHTILYANARAVAWGSSRPRGRLPRSLRLVRYVSFVLPRLVIGVTVRHRVVIVGSSVGGVRTARALRTEGYPGASPWSARSPNCPMTGRRCPSRCSPARGRRSARACSPRRPPRTTASSCASGWRPLALATEARQVLLADGDVLPYDDLVIATGASARPSPWQPESGVYTLRTLADCRTLKECFADGASVVMIGGGFIGAETAAAARVGRLRGDPGRRGSGPDGARGGAGGGCAPRRHPASPRGRDQVRGRSAGRSAGEPATWPLR